MRSLLLLVLAALALASCARETARFPAHDVPVNVAEAAALVSAYRSQHGLAPVSPDAGLTRIAADQARANAGIGDLSHDVGGAFASRLSRHGADLAYAAENLGAGGGSIPETIAQWKASAGHNRNLLNPRATRIGLARADSPGSRYKRYWALVLAAP